MATPIPRKREKILGRLAMAYSLVLLDLEIVSDLDFSVSILVRISSRGLSEFMNIAIGSDHRGLDYKKYVIGLLTEMGYSYKDFGSYTAESVDYPDIAKSVCEAVAESRFDYGILICGTGIGMSIAANKVRDIRAALCCDVFGAQRARLHNDANIVCLGAERGEAGVNDILKAFFTTKFEGGRHQRRLDKIRGMENAN